MKTNHGLARIAALLLITFSVISCEKDDGGFHQISLIETAVHNKVNDYRQSKGLPKLVLQPIMFKEARIYSEKMAGGLIPADGSNISSVFSVVKDKIGGTTEGWIVFTTPYAVSDSIVNIMLGDPGLTGVIEQTYTQSGVGVVYKNDLAYVTHIFLNIP